MEDSQIIQLFNERSEQAIVELSKKYGRLCSKIAVNIVKSESDVEECVNDAYLSIWNTIPPTIPKSLTAYVCQTIRNVALNRLISNQTAKRDGCADVDFDDVLGFAEGSYDIELMVEARDFRAAINSFLETLDKESRVIFVRKYFYCDSIDDIAKRFSKSDSAIGMKLTRIKKKLKKFLLQKGIEL